MKLIKPLSVLVMAFSTAVSAKVTIEIPNTIELLVVNGKKPQITGSFFSSTKNIELEDGVNQIVFRYTPFFNQGDKHISVQSDVVITKFSSKDKELTFSLPNYRYAHTAQNNIKNFDWALIDENGESLTVQQDRLLKEGMQIGRDFYQETLEYNRTKAIAAIEVDLQATPAPVEAQPVDSTAEEMLHFWYEKADPKTKARFKDYINAN